MKPIAIYVHIPFCVRKCRYCDFASFAGMEAYWQRYIDALLEEIDSRAEALKAFEAHSVFFGGGTPSILPGEMIESVLERLGKAVRFANDIEITIEANPGTLTDQKLTRWREAGVNRISLGVQSFDPELLRVLGRIHSANEAKEAVYAARNAGFENINIDLMYALPGQTEAIWMETLKTAAALPVTHISAYSLILEEGTEIKRLADAGRLSLPDEDTVITMQRAATAFLRENGIERYEVSNYARPGYESRHNITYWTDGDYLGLGSAAHSLMNNSRFSNTTDPMAYIAGEREAEREMRTDRDQWEEVLMLSTRMVRGLELSKWKEITGRDFETMFEKVLNRREIRQLTRIENGRFFLNEEGLELQDSVVLALMEEL